MGRQSAHLRVPVGKATSRTHCSPPQSKPSSWSLQPTRKPSLRRQNSASAWHSAQRPAFRHLLAADCFTDSSATCFSPSAAF